jgi:hypothetical protein
MRHSVSITLLLCAACAGQRPPATSAPSPAAAPPQAAGDSVRLEALRLPTTIAGFRLVRRRDYEDPRDGVLVRFHGPAPIAADVYLYPILPTSLATTDAGRDSAATLEFRRARDDIYTYQARTGGAEPKALGEQEVRAAAGAGRIARGHRGTFSYPRDGATWTSHLYVFGLRDRYVKVRSSYRQEDGPVEPPPALEQFVQALVAAVAAGYEPAAKP